MIARTKSCPLCRETLVELSPHNWVHVYELIPSVLSRTEYQRAS